VIAIKLTAALTATALTPDRESTAQGQQIRDRIVNSQQHDRTVQLQLNHDADLSLTSLINIQVRLLIK
jgi:hypothetical protein